jgi:hypothetical protein
MHVRAATPPWLAVNAKKHAVMLTIIAGYTNALALTCMAWPA